MLPDHRLAALLHDVKRSQVDRCLYHTTEEPPSLYTDHSCDRSRFPSEVLVELCSPRIEASKRPEEIWQVCFSPDGRRLASCGTDEAVSVWDVEHLTLLHELRGHPGGIGSVAWSPDSKLLVSCGKNHVAKVWHVDVSVLVSFSFSAATTGQGKARRTGLTDLRLQTGECVSTLSGFEEPISSCVWPADGRTFVLGSFDKKQSLCLWNMAEECVYSFAKTHRTEDVALSPDQRWLVAMDERCNLHVYNFGTRELVYDLALNSRATCVSISRDSKYMLVNKSDNEALLIDIETRETVQRYTGQTGGQFTIRSGFGGANENFVISGSEGEIFISWRAI
jgi:WD40 repeat protein